MNLQLLLATRRGLWRCPLEEEALCPADFHRDAPGSEVVALASSPASSPAPVFSPAAITSEGRLLLWDGAARAFAEGASLPREEEREWEVLAATGDGGFLAGACPAEIAAYDATGGAWTDMTISIAAEVRAGWQGLEAPYEPRITALLSREARAFASVSVGGLLQKTQDHWEAVGVAGLPRDLRDLAWAFGRLWLASGRGLFSWTPPESAPNPSDGTSASSPSTPADQLSSSGARSTALSLQKSLLPAEASFVAALVVGQKGLVAAVAPGPPATWRGPDGARMSLWLVEAPEIAPRRLAGPFHGSILALFAHGEHVIAGTSDGELWRIPFSGKEVDRPWLEDLPPVNDLMVIDLEQS